MNLNRISMPTKFTTLAMGTLLCGSVAMCNHSRNEYVNTLKNHVKENVTPEVYQNYEKQAAQFGENKEVIFKNAYDSIQFANRNYFEGMQNIKDFE